MVGVPKGPLCAAKLEVPCASCEFGHSNATALQRGRERRVHAGHQLEGRGKGPLHPPVLFLYFLMHPPSSGAGDAEYMRAISEVVPGALQDFRPDLVLYDAGVRRNRYPC